MLAATTCARCAAKLRVVLRVPDVQSTVRVGDPVGVSVESVGQAAAGAMLVAIALFELAFGFWTAGWHQRAVALSVACVGVGFLLSGLAEIALARRAARSRVEAG